MKQIPAKKLARVLRVLVLATFVCNLAVLALLPVPIYYQAANVPVPTAEIVLYFRGLLLFSYIGVWRSAYTAVLTLFLWACGGCTAVILWQGKRVLDSILKEDTFSLRNAANMRRAAVCCFVISGAALARTIWGIVYYQSIRALLTYNTLFVPMFLMAGLLCMVMSALCRQAAELKADSELTI